MANGINMYTYAIMIYFKTSFKLTHNWKIEQYDWIKDTEAHFNPLDDEIATGTNLTKLASVEQTTKRINSSKLSIRPKCFVEHMPCFHGACTTHH